MDGAKALALDAFAATRGLAMLRFDYSGTGASGGEFEDGTLDRWLDEALAMIDALTDGPLILVGSSMGGWIALHVALRRARAGRGAGRHRRGARFHRLGLYADEQAAIARRRPARAAQSVRRRAAGHDARLLAIGPGAAAARRRRSRSTARCG